MNCFFFSSTVYAYILKRTQETKGNNIYIPKTFQQSNLFYLFSFVWAFYCQTKCFTLKQNYKMRFYLSAAGNKEVPVGVAKRKDF